MPWLRIGDTAANHPIALAVLEDPAADDRLLNEVFGFVTRCALQSTAHLTDYMISRGTAIQVAGYSRIDALLAAAIDAGYLVPAEMIIDGAARPAYKLLDDPDFIHMRTREEIEWERQRKTDNSNPALIIPVRIRDGDACRYCGLVVDFRPGQRKGRIAGTYDHREPGQPATVETYVVCCRACNAARGDDTNADAALPLLPEPEKPYYSAHTIEWIRTNDWAKRNGVKPPRKGKIIAPGNPAPKPKATPANGSTTGPAPGINGSSNRIPTGRTTSAHPGNGSTTDQTPAPDTTGATGAPAQHAPNPPTPPARTPEQPAGPPGPEHVNPAPTRADTGSVRNPQIPQNGRLQDLETPGRVGSGRAGTGREGNHPHHPRPSDKPHTSTSRARPRNRKGKQ